MSGRGPQKTCPACDAKVHVRKARCPCGHVFASPPRPPLAPLPTTLTCIDCGDKPLDAFTPTMQKDFPSTAAIRVCIDCTEKKKAEDAAEKRQTEKRKRQEERNKFVTVDLGTAQYLRLGPSTRRGDLALAEGGRPLKRVKLILGSQAVTAPKDASTHATAMTVQRLLAAGAVVPDTFAVDALVVIPCTAKQFTRGKSFPVSWVLVGGEEVKLKKNFTVPIFNKETGPVIVASKIDLKPQTREDVDAKNAAHSQRGTVESVWRDGERSYAALKALANAGNWDGLLAACGKYVEGRRPASFESFNVRASRRCACESVAVYEGASTPTPSTRRVSHRPVPRRGHVRARDFGRRGLHGRVQAKELRRTTRPDTVRLVGHVGRRSGRCNFAGPPPSR